MLILTILRILKGCCGPGIIGMTSISEFVRLQLGVILMVASWSGPNK